MTPLLDVRITAGYGRATALSDLAFSISEGEAFGLIGESGAGKSTVALALLNLLSWTGGWVRGEVRLRGRNLLDLPQREMRRVRGKEIALVPQSPVAALNPVMSIESHCRESWRAHSSLPWKEARDFVMELLRSVRLPGEAGFLKRKPGELSVGMAQRLVIALALLHRPALIIADEPTSALDPLTQSGILDLFAEINYNGSAILYISHDLPSVSRLCARAAILKSGRIVESGGPEIFCEPANAYARQLIESIPSWPPDYSVRKTRAGSILTAE